MSVSLYVTVRLLKELIGNDFELDSTPASAQPATTTSSKKSSSSASSSESDEDEDAERANTTRISEREVASAHTNVTARSTMDAFAAELLSQVNVTPLPTKLTPPRPPPTDALAQLEEKTRECDFYKNQNRMLISRMGGSRQSEADLRSGPAPS